MEDLFVDYFSFMYERPPIGEFLLCYSLFLTSLYILFFYTNKEPVSKKSKD